MHLGAYGYCSTSEPVWVSEKWSSERLVDWTDAMGGWGAVTGGRRRQERHPSSRDGEFCR